MGCASRPLSPVALAASAADRLTAADAGARAGSRPPLRWEPAGRGATASSSSSSSTTTTTTTTSTTTDY